MKLIRLILFPFSLIYSALLWIRNKLYDRDILKGQKGEIKTIVVGNLSLGGTGKTPHTSAILEFLTQKGVKVALLSRGYGRQTKGFYEVDIDADPLQVGDEPTLLKSKWPEIPMAVCENRVLGISELKKKYPFLEWVVLDDAFQHRKLKADISILLTDANKPFNKDFVVPTGTLRDHKSQYKRADILLITKFVTALEPHEMVSWKSKHEFFYRKPTFFSKLRYSSPIGVYDGKILDFHPEEVAGLTGIAQPEVFKAYLEKSFNLKKFKTYPDHHPFSVNDLAWVHSYFDTFTRPLKALLVTEKDAVKLKHLKEWKQMPIFAVPIDVEVKNEKNEDWLLAIDTLMQQKKNN